MGFSPFAYFLFKLWEHKPSEWARFLAPGQVPELHRQFNRPNYLPENRLLQDKLNFSKELKAKGINTVPTEAVHSESFQWQPGLFIKPNSGARGENCYFTRNDKPDYLFAEFSNSPAVHQSEVFEEPLNFISQPLLRSGKFVSQTGDGIQAERLPVIRVITAKQYHSKNNDAFTAVVVGAFIDIKVDGKHYRQHISNGTFELEGKIYELEWNCIQHMVNQAHQIFPSMFTIGWDIGWSEEILLLEGNGSWDPAPFQILTRQPWFNEERLILYQEQITRLQKLA
ncbi:hypothetical protein [Lysobacter sp. N42]|uniref:hypothetical protein n=2 Tax=Gammaproteobacteria TaxID=1236 RepID=UPI000DCF6DD3|nr:hypothetical protein [Lysobacter sp. N42]TCZ91437.1 hypothetical protein EYQ95_05805 [Lysobacter sp. N42]